MAIGIDEFGRFDTLNPSFADRRRYEELLSKPKERHSVPDNVACMSEHRVNCYFAAKYEERMAMIRQLTLQTKISE